MYSVERSCRRLSDTTAAWLSAKPSSKVIAATRGGSDFSPRKARPSSEIVTVTRPDAAMTSACASNIARVTAKCSSWLG